MKCFIHQITENIRLPLLVLTALFITLTTVGQKGTTTNQQPAYINKACGVYPSVGTHVQAVSVTYGGSGCTTTITPGTDTVYFIARDTIILLPGFLAKTGSVFVARLQPIDTIHNAEIKNNITFNADTAITNEANAANLLLIQDINVAPNPFTHAFSLTINAKKDSKIDIIIYNAAGVKVIQQPRINLVKGSNTLTLNASKLLSGIYMLEVNFGDSKLVKKIIKAS